MASMERGSARDPGGRLKVRTRSVKPRREALEGKEDGRWRALSGGQRVGLDSPGAGAAPP